MKTAMLSSILLLSAAMACIPTSLATYRSRPGKSAALGTFNAAMTSSIPNIKDRAHHLTQLIRQSNLDVICLQEMWRTDIQRRLYEDVRDLYPYSHSLINFTSPGSFTSGPACTLRDVELYGMCLMKFCYANPTDVECPIRDCLEELLNATYECRYCMIFHLRPLPPNLGICLTHPANYYERSFGLMLLSRKATSNVVVRGYLGQTSDLRGYIKASVADIGDVFCTHLSTTIGDIPGIYAGPPVTNPFLFRSYPEQQFQELKHLLQEASFTENSILMGDFNHGPTVATPPDVSEIIYDSPIHYGLVNAHGYFSPYVLWDGRCTLCQENEVVSISSRIVDHIYMPVTSSNRVMGVKRIWDNEFTSLTRTPISDHYGVQLLIRELVPCYNNWWFCLYRQGGNAYPRNLPNIDQILAEITPGEEEQ